MFKNLFNKKKVSMPVFPVLESSTLKDKFFVRTKPWDWLTQKEIYVAAKLNDKPTMITMEFWPQQVYLFADGQITVSEFVHASANRFIVTNDPVPELLDAALIEQLEILVNEMEIVELRDVKTDLAPNIQLPLSQQLNGGAQSQDVN